MSTFFGANYTNGTSLAAPPTLAGILKAADDMRKAVESNPLHGLEVTTSRYMPKTMKDDEGVEREVLYVMASPERTFRQAMLDGKYDVPRMVFVLGEPVKPVSQEHPYVDPT